MNVLHRLPEELCRHADGSLSEPQEHEVEEHLRDCSRCAAYADGYTRFAVPFDSEEGSDSPELLAAVERLDSRMRLLLELRTRHPDQRSFPRLREAFGLGELVRLATGRLEQLCDDRPELGLAFARGTRTSTLAFAASEASNSEGALEDVLLIDRNGAEARTMARLAGIPRWPSERVDLLLELDLKYCGWDATVTYTLPGAAPGRAAVALLLYEGAVDTEGLIEVQRIWAGPAPQSFEPSRLKICLAEPQASA